MSKKKKKFKQYQNKSQPSVQPAVSATALSSSSPSVSNVVDSQPAAKIEKAAKPTQPDPNAAVYAAHAAEYKDLRVDLIRVIVVNGLLFAATIAMYFINQSNSFLDNWYSRLF